MRKLTWRQATAWHLKRQHLDVRAPRNKLLQVVSELCGLHAQVMSSADLTAWCRIEGLSGDDIYRALWTENKIIKTWAMRGTLHLLPASEQGIWVQAFTAYDRQRTQSWFRYFEITEDQLERITEAVGEALRDRMLTRQELADEIMRITGLTGIGDKLRQGWGSLLKPASYRGHLCFGPNKGNQVQFTRAAGASAHASDPLAEVTLKYFATYGPATAKEFSRWLQIPFSKAKALIKALPDDLAEVDIEGTLAFMLRTHVPKAAQIEPIRTVRLLPAFDQYVFAAGLRSSRLLPGDFHSRIYRSQGWFSAVLLVDGRLEGVWRFDRKGKNLAVAIEPFTKPPVRVKRAAEDEAERLAEFMDRKLELSWN